MLGHAFNYVPQVIFRIGEHNVRSRRAIEKSAPCLPTECSMQRSAGGM
jgi:hypothetical protein